MRYKLLGFSWLWGVLKNGGRILAEAERDAPPAAVRAALWRRRAGIHGWCAPDFDIARRQGESEIGGEEVVENGVGIIFPGAERTGQTREGRAGADQRQGADGWRMEGGWGRL